MRVEIPEVIWQATTIAGFSALAPKPNASIEVRIRNAADTTGVVINDAETAGGTLANPLTADSLGRVFGWLEEGSYDLIVDGDTANKFRLEAVRGTRTDIILGADVSLTRVAANVLGLGANDHLATPGTEVSALPGSPQDGEIIHYKADATAGVIWTFRYRAGSASSSKWEYIGGAALYAATDAQESTSSVTYAALATAGPSITVPLLGDYLIEIGSLMFMSVGTGSLAQFHSFDLGATPASDADAVQMNPTALNFVTTGATARKKTAVPAGSAVVSKYRTSGTTPTAFFSRRYMRIIPIRVGP